MPKYTINGVTYNSDSVLSDADLEELAGGVATPSLPDVRSGQMVETGGGAAVGMPRRGREAVVQPITPLEAVGTGVFKGAVLNPAMAVTQLVGGQQGRTLVEGLQNQYAQTRKDAGMSGFDVSELAGAIISPVNKLLPGGGYTGGALGAATQPVEGANLSSFDVITEKAKQLAFGAVAGKVTENLIGALTPKLKEGARELMDKGIPVSPGQAYEGAPGWLFRQMESLGLGPKLSEVNKSFNKAVGNEVLKSIDQTLPDTVKAGQGSVRLTQRRISNFYDDSLLNIGTNPFDREYKDSIRIAIQNATADIANPAEKQFVQNRLVTSLNQNIGNRIQKDGISGKNLKLTQEWLKKQVTKLDGKTDVVSTSLKSGYADTLAGLNQFISRVDTSGNIAKADQAWAKLYSFADASKTAAKEGGVFSPEQLSQASVRQAPSLLSAGGGRSPLGLFAENAVEVLGKQEKPTGLSRAMLASKAATGAATTIAAPAVAIPVLVASGMTYAAAKQLMKNPSAARIAVQKALQDNPAMFGAAGQQLLDQLLREE